MQVGKTLFFLAFLSCSHTSSLRIPGNLHLHCYCCSRVLGWPSFLSLSFSSSLSLSISLALTVLFCQKRKIQQGLRCATVEIISGKREDTILFFPHVCSPSKQMVKYRYSINYLEILKLTLMPRTLCTSTYS